MKKLIYFAAAAFLLAGCNDNNDTTGNDYGRLTISCGTDLTIGSRALTAPAGADFSLTLLGDDYTNSWTTVADFNNESPLLKEGKYTVSIAHGDPEAEGIDLAYYATTQEITVIPRRTTPITLTAKIANSQTRVIATERFLTYFHDASFTVTTGSGNTFDYKPTTAENGDPVFVKAATTPTVTGTARHPSQTGVDEGPKITFTPQTLDATQPRTCHTFRFDATDAGSATLTILFDDKPVETISWTFELNNDAIK